MEDFDKDVKRGWAQPLVKIDSDGEGNVQARLVWEWRGWEGKGGGTLEG